MLSRKLRVAASTENRSLYITNFGEYAVGAPPPDWTNRWVTGGFTFNIETVAGTISGQAMRWDKSVANRQAISWDRIPNYTTDFEILCRCRAIETLSATSNIIALLGRADGGAGAEVGYRSAIAGASDQTRWVNSIQKYVSGTPSNLTSSLAGPSPNYTTNAWVYCRYRLVGNQHQSKIWYSGAAEPGTWLQDVTDASSPLTIGWVGLNQATASPDAEIDYFAVATSANGREPVTITVPV